MPTTEIIPSGTKRSACRTILQGDIIPKMSDVNHILTSLLLSHPIDRYFWRIIVIEASYILERIFIFLEA